MNLTCYKQFWDQKSKVSLTGLKSRCRQDWLLEALRAGSGFLLLLRRSDMSDSWTAWTPWTAARQASLSITNSRSSFKLMSIEWVMPSSHLILCRPLLLLPSIFCSIGVFSNESALFTSDGQVLELQLQHQSFQ